MADAALLLFAVAALIASLSLALVAFGIYQRWVAASNGQIRSIIPKAGQPQVELPPGLVAWISDESEPWAREELTSRAQRLYAELDDWVLVELKLKNDLGATPSPDSGVL